MTESFLLNYRRYKSKPWIGPQFQAHRGFWVGGAQENSLESFRQAQEKKFLMCECDVQLSRDSIPVVTHDENLLRLNQRTECVSELTAEELKKYGKISSLEEILNHPDIPEFLNVELKNNSVIDSRLEILVAQVIKKTQSHRRIIFSSFNPATIFKLHQLMPEVPRGWLVNPFKEEDWNSIFFRRLWVSPLLPFDYLHLHESMISTELLNQAQKSQIPIAVWTVNDQQRANELLQQGVQSIITDRLMPKIGV